MTLVPFNLHKESRLPSFGLKSKTDPTFFFCVLRNLFTSEGVGVGPVALFFRFIPASFCPLLSLPVSLTRRLPTVCLETFAEELTVSGITSFFLIHLRVSTAAWWLRSFV